MRPLEYVNGTPVYYMGTRNDIPKLSVGRLGRQYTGFMTSINFLDSETEEIKQTFWVGWGEVMKAAWSVRQNTSRTKVNQPLF